MPASLASEEAGKPNKLNMTIMTLNELQRTEMQCRCQASTSSLSSFVIIIEIWKDMEL